jgi:chemotaxis protein methyltransferase CheR
VAVSPISSTEENVALSAQESGAGWSIPALTDPDFARFRTLILNQTGINLNESKRHLLVARLAQHLQKLGLRTFAEYYDYLARDASGNKLRAFINRITTNKTSFFREPHHFEFLRAHLIPQLRKKGRKQLRIWSAACSSGEEPYSIAITVQEALGPRHDWDVQILASDIDTEILAQAEGGTYTIESLETVSAERRRLHFLRGYGTREGLAQVRPELRQMVDFRRINLNEPNWGVHARFDAIFCRNVIIYFDRPLQLKIVERMAGHLKPEGYFFSGHSEHLYWLRELLVTVEPTIYRLNQGGTTQ